MKKFCNIGAVLILSLFVFAPFSHASGPVSTWKPEELSKIHEGFMATLRLREKQWFSYINTHSEQYERLYGKGIKNAYDLYLKELLAPSPAAENSPVIQQKTIKRLNDLAWVSGKSFPRLANTVLYHLKMLSYRNGSLHVIPFDVLEFTSANRVILPYGPEANLNDSDGVLSVNDKVFFMALDSGHKIGRDYILKAYRDIRELSEIEVSYAPEGENGWVYLASFASDIPKSEIDYVNLFSDSSTIATPFMLAQSKPIKAGSGMRPSVDICSWAIAPSIGGTLQDFHNSFYIDTKMAFRMGINISENKDDFNLCWRAWYDGSVIGFKRVSWKLSTPLGIGAPVIFTDVISSAFSVYDENFLATPFDPSLILKGFTLGIGEDLNSTALSGNYSIITANNRKGFKVEGSMDSMKVIDELKPGLKDIFNVITGPAGSICMTGGVNDFLASNARFRLEHFDKKDSISRRTYVLDVRNFKNRQEEMYIEWTAVPFFSSKGNYNWKSLELMQKHRTKPLSVSVDGGAKQQLGRFTHRPDIEAEKKFYKY